MLYDYRHRLYHSELGRFLQPDPKHFDAGDYNLYRYCHNDPVNKTDPSGLLPGDPYPTADAAAIEAIRDINETSIRLGLEYAGRIYRSAEGVFSYTAPNAGTNDTSDSGQVPASTTNEGRYHTHGKEEAGYSSNRFSKDDKTNSEKEGKPSYIGTPTKEVKKYTPEPGQPQGGKSETISTSYPLPKPLHLAILRKYGGIKFVHRKSGHNRLGGSDRSIRPSA